MDETLVHQPPDEKRLNPFAFPAETNVRFTLLIVAVAMLVINTSVVLLAVVQGDSSSLLDPANLSPQISGAEESPAFLTETFREFGGVLVTAASFLIVFGGLLTLALVVAALVYRGHPGRIRKSQKLKLLAAGKDPKLSGELSTLAAHAGITPPRVEIGEGRTGPADGQVFGVGGHYVMRLGGGMPLLLRKAPALFRATVLHEVAHIANGDVTRAYFSQSLWLTVIILLIVPLGLAYCWLFVSHVVRDILSFIGGQTVDFLSLVTESTPVFLWSMLQLGGLLGLYATIRASLLRAREIYADWRAALWGGGDGLKTIFGQDSAGHKRRGWLRLLRLHPAPRERLRLLNDPRQLFAIPNDVPLLVGALIGAAVSGVLLLSTLVVAGLGSTVILAALAIFEAGGLLALLALLMITVVGVLMLAMLLLPQLGLAYTAAGSLGLQAQRDAVAALALNERRGLRSYLHLMRPAALFAIGLEFGLLIAPSGFFTAVPELFGFEGSLLTPLVVIPMTSLIWVVVTTFVVWLWLVWASYTAQRLLGAQPGDKPPEGRRRFLTGWLAVILWLILVPALAIQNAIWYDVSPAGHLLSAGDTLIVALVGVTLAGAAAAIGWLMAEVRRGGAITCPACERKTKQRHAVGRSCEHCGADLAPWIIAQPGLS